MGQLVIYASIAVVLILLAVGGFYLWRLFRKEQRDRHTDHAGRGTQPQVEKTDFQSLGLPRRSRRP